MAINLTYKSQETVLNQGLANLLNSSMLKDTVLACSEGKCLKAHRLILATFSPYFKELLSVCKEPMPTILLPDVKISVMEIILDFMYTGNIRVKKDIVAQLVEANKRLSIIGLNDLLSKHDGINQPPNKKQRTETGSQSLEKPSSLFRPWDSPVLAQRPAYPNPMPWLPSMYGAPMFPIPMAPAMNLANTTPFYNTNGIAPPVPSPLSWKMPFGYHFLPDTASSTNIAATIPSHNETPLSSTAPLFQNTVAYPTSFGEDKLTVKDPESMTKTVDSKGTTSRKSRGKSGGKYLVPGKERCDICKRDFFNLLGHQKAAHGLLKKPIQCCGREFTTRQEIREHKKFNCDFRNSW